MKSKFILIKFFSFFLALTTMCLTTLAFSFTANAEGESDIVILIGGVEVTKDNANDIFGNQTASYDYETGVLTLNNANITSGSVLDGVTIGLFAENDLTLKLEGKNRIELPNDSSISYGITVDGELTVQGGSIYVKSGDVEASLEGISSLESVGIFTTEGISIENAVVEAYAGNIDASEGYLSNSYGVLTTGKIEIKEDGHLIGCGGSITGNGYYASSIGINAIGSESSLIYVIVAEGGLSGYGGDVSSSEISMSSGIYLSYGDMGALINDSFMNFEGGTATAKSDSGSTTYAISNGAYICGGSFGADGGQLSFTAKECFADEVCGDAFKVEASTVNGNAFGGYVSINCEEILPNKAGYGFVGTNVTLNSQSGVAINAELGIIISDNLIVSSPEEGYISEVEGDTSYFTVFNTEGISASEVNISVLTHKVFIRDASRNLSVLVPDGESINDTYRERFGLNDFSDYLITEKEGYTFHGWYADEEFTQEFSFNDEITSTITVYGKWVEAEDSPSGDVATPGDNGSFIFFIIATASLSASLLVMKKRRA